MQSIESLVTDAVQQLVGLEDTGILMHTISVATSKKVSTGRIFQYPECDTRIEQSAKSLRPFMLHC